MAESPTKYSSHPATRLGRMPEREELDLEAGPESRRPAIPLSGDRGRLPRKEVIQPHVPVRLPCYDFTPITGPTLVAYRPPEGVGPAPSSLAGFRGVTGGVYKTRERIHRTVLTRGY